MHLHAIYKSEQGIGKIENAVNEYKNSAHGTNENQNKTIKILAFGESTTQGAGTDSYRKGLSDSLLANVVSFDFIGSLKNDGKAWDSDHQGMSGNACKHLLV